MEAKTGSGVGGVILAVNISNSNILLGAYEDGQRRFCSGMHTNPLKSPDEYAAQIGSVLALYGVQAGDISGVILSCVVPSMLSCVRGALARLYPGRIYLVGPGLKTGVPIRTDDPSQLGSELVCCAAAALAQCGPPCVAVSMDTAITLVAVDQTGALRGGAILPGVRIGVEALCARTAQLPQIELAPPAGGVLGTNTVASMQSGAVYGTACMLDGMLDRFADALGCVPGCVATGELAPVILPHCAHPIAYQEHLVLDGLYLLYQKNAK